MRAHVLVRSIVILFLFACMEPMLFGNKQHPRETAGPDVITFHRVDDAWEKARGKGVTVAVLDWMFDLKSAKAKKYVDPVSLVPGQAIGTYKPWHGEWMAGIIHEIAPEARIIPIRCRPASLPGDDDIRVDMPYEKYVPLGIRYAADHGAAVVTNSMGLLRDTPALRSAVAYAAARGTVFVDVHPEYVDFKNGSYQLCEAGQLNSLIIHCGIVSVPGHPRKSDDRRDIYTWPYESHPVFKDGWGYSNGPPAVAGVVALMKSVAPGLSVETVKRILIQSAVVRLGFRVMDAAAAVTLAEKMSGRERVGEKSK